MAAETRHTGLTADDRSDIRSTVLDTRELIEDDLYRQLERYGVYEDERVDLEQLGHLDSYDIETRRKINAAIDRELEATEGDYQRSLKNYVREATKTYLNRLVALKAIEVRGLVTETLMERPEYGNRSEMLRTVDEVAGELTDQQDGGQSAALELAYTELTDEIGVIFEESEHTAIDLDFAVREEVIEQLNEIDESVWESDEAMGWVYQYFGEKEREEIDDRISDENYKVQDTDVATKTQLFTPRYIVEWMVDNSLGRLWLEMLGEDTDIDAEKNCFYLAPLEDSLIDRDSKDVRDIKVLDPACGSGHMLFYAFDVLYEMYLEQGDVAEKYIPREILKNNLYGIDIDPGAAQLAALALYVKAKSTEPEVEIEHINIISADTVLVNGEKKEEVLAQTDSKLEKRVLEQVWRSFENIREWGSLVRIEERIEEIIDEELEEVRATGQTQFTDDGLAKQSSVVSFSGEEESWEQVKERLLSQVAELAEEALERNDPIEEMFVGEVEKSVRLIDFFLEDYDVVITNPPYLYRDKMGEGLRDFLKDNYEGSADMYAAFIERTSELAGPDKYTAMITMETFMFLYNYRGMRPKILDEMNFVDAVHLEHRDEGHMNIAFVLRSKDKYDNRTSRFIQTTNSDDKLDTVNRITNEIRGGNQPEIVYTADQNSFKDIDRTPIIYWFGKEILDFFTKYPNLGEVADVMEGLGTGDDDKYIRKWWEIKEDRIGDQYFWFARSGDGDLYYESYEHLVFWENDGEEIRNYSGSRIGNTDSYGEPGLTFRNFAKYFTSRIHEEGYIFSNKAHFVYTGDRDTDYILVGYLSSSLSRFIMNGLNPGLEFKVGDGRRLPINKEIFTRKDIGELTELAIDRQRDKNKIKEYKPNFEPEILLNNYDSLDYYLDMCKADVLVMHGMIDNKVFDEYGISELTKERIYNEVPQNMAELSYLVNTGGLDASNQSFRSNIQTKELPEDEYQEVISNVSILNDNNLRKISEELGVSPYTIAKVRHEHDLYTHDEKRKAAGRLLSYYLGCAMGRWEIEDLAPDDNGIIVFDSDFEDDIMSYMRRCIELTYGEDELYERESEIEEMLNKSIEDWLRNTFFRYHHCKEYRRRGQRIPIYWQLESDEGAFSCFVYYHKMDADTLHKLRGQYIDKKLDTLQNRLEAIESELETADGDHARDLRSEKEEIQANIDDITDFRDRVDSLIEEGFEPEFEAGIWENIQKVDEHDLLSVPLDKL
jgi:hypothetical protein